MKKLSIISMRKLSIILLFAFATSSCQKENTPNSNLFDASVVVKATAGNILDRTSYTSTDYTTTSFINGDEMGIFTIHPDEASDPAKMLDVNFSYVFSGAWSPKSPDNEILYRRTADDTAWRNMNFYAYYPHSGVATSPVKSVSGFNALFELPTDQTDPQTIAQCGILRAVPIIDKDNSDAEVPFQFKIVPALIEMQIYKDNWEPSETPRVSQVSISGCYLNGQFSLAEDDIKVQPSALPSIVNHNYSPGAYPALADQSAATPLVVRFYIVPREMVAGDKMSFEFSVTGDKVADNIQDVNALGRYVCEMPNLVGSTPVKYLPGNRYTYRIKLQKQKVIVQFGELDEWGKGEIIDIGVIRPEREDATMACTTSLSADTEPNTFILPAAATDATLSISSGLYSLANLSVSCDYGTPSSVNPSTGEFTITNIPKAAQPGRKTTINVMCNFGSDANKGVIKTYYLKHE